MRIKQERVVERSLVQIVKVDPDSRPRAPGGAASDFVHIGQEGVIKHPLATAKLKSTAPNGHLSLEFVYREIDAFFLQSTKSRFDAFSRNPRFEVVKLDSFEIE